MAIRIVTDSASDLPSEIAEQLDITVIPCSLVIDDLTYRDGVDLTADEFYRRLESSQRLPTTSQPTVGAFQSVYQNLLAEGHEIVSIHVSGKLSGTINSANQAKNSLGDSAPIEIIDSELASIGQTLVVKAAAEQALQSDSRQEVAAQARQQAELTHVFLALDTLEYLQKGGRIGKAQAFVGSLMSVKPILTLQQGEVHPLERPRNHERAMRRLVDLARGCAPIDRIGINYSTESAWADDLQGRLTDLLPAEQAVVGRFGPALGTYVGPRALGIAIISAG